MNEVRSPLPDDELIRRIRDAFDQQATPACPIEDDWFSPARRETVTQIHPALFGSTWMASLVALAAIIGIAIVVFGSNVDQAKFESPRDELVDSIDPFDVDSIESVAQQGDLDEEPSVVSQNPKPFSEGAETAEEPRDPRSAGLLNVINTANDFLARRNDNPDLLIEQLHTRYALDRSDLQSVFRAIGVPAGITSVRRGVDSQRSWAQGKDQVAFTYGFEYPHVLNDLTRLINALYGDEIVDDILDGLRDDVDGPRIDLRNDFFPLLDDKVVIVVSTRPEPLEDLLTFVLPVKDGTTTWRLVNQAHRIQPESSRETYRTVEMLVLVTKEAKRKAWCIVENHLIIGDLKNVQATIDRLNGE
jgi:hypothetical protein